MTADLENAHKKFELLEAAQYAHQDLGRVASLAAAEQQRAAVELQAQLTREISDARAQSSHFQTRLEMALLSQEVIVEAATAAEEGARTVKLQQDEYAAEVAGYDRQLRDGDNKFKVRACNRMAVSSVRVRVLILG
jgi:hypothetical protein